MSHVFAIQAMFPVPDGTWVSPFLNSKDSQSDLPFDLLDGFSVAAGVIEPNTRSRIHVMPFVAQVTFVRSGVLIVRTKGPSDTAPRSLRLVAGQAVLTEPGEFFQLVNEQATPTEVLYIVSPAYVFDMGPNGELRFDDAVVLTESWEDLAAADLRMRVPMPTAEQRNEALRRIRATKQAASRGP
jgi:mannose-6-phosphate isomerase-like protein (cupin superfamily)